jgi:hypothetical protein
MVQLCEKALAAKNHNPAMIKDLNLIGECSALSHWYEEYRSPTMLPTDRWDGLSPTLKPGVPKGGLRIFLVQGGSLLIPSVCEGVRADPVE